MKQIALICFMAAAAHAEPASIAGVWIWGMGPDPAPGPVRYSEYCGSRQATIEIVVRDGVVEAKVESGHGMAPGARPPMPPYATVVEETLRGRLDGERLVLTGSHDVRHVGGQARALADEPEAQVRVPADTREPVRVELRYRARSGHFVGTRNGAAVWVARGRRVPSTVRACPP